MKVLKNFGILISSAVLFGFISDTFAASAPSECVITIKSVQLKKDSGEWITVIEPDYQVDLVNQEPAVSFFNNGRRVPPGNYSNFKALLLRTIKVKDTKRLSFIYEAPNNEIAIYGSRDFPEPLKVKTASFIGVRFGLDLSNTIVDSGPEAHFLPPKKVKSATVTVDDQKIAIPSDGLRMDYH